MATFHESIPDKDRPPDEALLWRYCSFSKFASLLAGKHLFMARADRFEDVFEGAISRPTLSRLMDLLKPHFNLRDRFARQGSRDPREDEEFIRKWLLDGPTITYLSCWYSGSAECDAMWKVYGETKESVALKTTVGRLKTVLPDDVFLLPVRYLSLSDAELPSDHRIWQFAFKRLEYAYESEFRCMKFDGTEARPSAGHKIEIDPSRLVTEVVVSPRAQSWFTGLNVEVRQSAMSGKP